MNRIQNDKGEWVTAVGAPGSQARVAVQHPNLIGTAAQMIEYAREDRSEIQSAEAILENHLRVNGVKLTGIEFDSVLAELEKV